MLTLFASIVGFIGSIIPEMFKLIKDKNDKSYLLKVLDKKMEDTQNNMLIKQLEYELAERKLLNENSYIKKPWIECLNGSVRPILAYGFFVIYCVMKYIEYKLISKHIAPEIFAIWNENDQAIFAGIISFYFGQRTFTKNNSNTILSK